MKRGGPLRRRVGLQSTARLERRAPLAQVSVKRKRQAADRARVRREVLERAGFGCEAVDVVPEVRCRFYPPDRPGLEVDERRGGSFRSIEWLDPESCQALCPAHHDWKHAYPSQARERGLR